MKELKGKQLKWEIVEDNDEVKIIDCFIADIDDEKGMTIKLLDSSESPTGWKIEEDGSVNIICINFEISEKQRTSRYFETVYKNLVEHFKTHDIVTLSDEANLIDSARDEGDFLGEISPCAFG